MSSPFVSICIPTLGREEKVLRLINQIYETTEDYRNHELLVERDQFGPGRQGCPRTLARAVVRAHGDYIAFLGNDTLPQRVWLRAAMGCMLRTFEDGIGLVGFNDLYWKDGRCLHWLASKKLLDNLG